MSETTQQPHYWKIKAIELEGQVLQREMQASYARWQQKRAAAYAAAQLDPAAVYQMDDAAEALTPLPSGGKE
jgi:hypothetical protein